MEAEASRISFDTALLDLSCAQIFTENQFIGGDRVNDANQAAILRLMNEMGDLADGDLTIRATVTEDITGTIADSINYAIGVLRELARTTRDQPLEEGLRREAEGFARLAPKDLPERKG